MVNYKEFAEYLKILRAILSCHFNVDKIRIWQGVLGMTILNGLKYFQDNQELAVFEDILTFEICIVQTVHVSGKSICQSGKL